MFSSWTRSNTCKVSQWQQLLMEWVVWVEGQKGLQRLQRHSEKGETGQGSSSASDLRATAFNLSLFLLRQS
eukprot:4406071-Karenia_brevis.AAC.1